MASSNPLSLQPLRSGVSLLEFHIPGWLQMWMIAFRRDQILGRINKRVGDGGQQGVDIARCLHKRMLDPVSVSAGVKAQLAW